MPSEKLLGVAEVGRGVPSVYEFSACDVSSYDSLRTAFEQRPRTGPKKTERAPR